MRVVMSMKWAGITPEQYNQLHEIVRWEERVPAGGVFHVASFDSAGLRVTDIWESTEECMAFVQSQILPGVAKLGITSQPEVDFTPVHRVFVPGLVRG